MGFFIQQSYHISFLRNQFWEGHALKLPKRGASEKKWRRPLWWHASSSSQRFWRFVADSRCSPFTPLLVVPVCAKQFWRYYNGIARITAQPTLWSDEKVHDSPIVCRTSDLAAVKVRERLHPNSSTTAPRFLSFRYCKSLPFLVLWNIFYMNPVLCCTALE